MRRGLLISTVTVVLICLAGELVARIWLRSHWETGALREELGRVSITSLIEFDDDPEILYRLRRNEATRFQESLVTTDPSGFRIGSEPTREDAAAVRIALLGDSTSFGWRVDYEQSYGERLRAGLQDLAGSPVVLRNMSVPGYNASQELHAWLRSLPGFRPDLLIVHHDHNDSQPTGWGYENWKPPEYGDNFLHSALVKLILRRIRTLRGFGAAQGESGADVFADGYCVGGPLYEAMMNSRRALAEAANANGIPVLIVLFDADAGLVPGDPRSERWMRLHEQAADRFRSMGYAVLDLYPAYQRWLRESGASDLRDFWMDPEDHHPNPRGHAFIAGTILGFIRDTPDLAKVVFGRD